jgi:hypothetical protein
MTGDFEAVVQLAVRQLNGVLGTLHQNGLTSTSALKLLHNLHARVGDPRRVPPDLTGFGDWANEVAAVERRRRLYPSITRACAVCSAARVYRCSNGSR